MKIALVTGSTSGIGYEISKRLLKMNYIVYGIGRNFIKMMKIFLKNMKILSLLLVIYQSLIT